jgi:hypothetical protein
MVFRFINLDGPEINGLFLSCIGEAAVYNSGDSRDNENYPYYFQTNSPK